jgi:hypothetical protein
VLIKFSGIIDNIIKGRLSRLIIERSNRNPYRKARSVFSTPAS